MSIFCCLGPLFRISLLSTVSPCLLSPDDQKAATSYKKLNDILSKGVIWHKTSTSSGNDDDDDSSGGGGFSVGQFLGTATPTVKIKSDIRIVDGPWGHKSPRIEITPSNSNNNNGKSRDDDNDDDDDADENEMDPLCQKTKKKKTITVPLSQISVCEVVSPSITTSGVSSVSSWLSKNVTGTKSSSSSASSRMVVVYGKQSEHNPEGQGDELLRWELPSGTPPEGEETVVDYLTILLEWDRLRRKKEDIDDDEEEEEEEEDSNNNNNNNATSPKAASSSSTGKKTKKKGFLKTQAEKAAHFAKREIEMRERRREREQRKAKYLKEAGGLKYTAIAMANRET